MSIDFAYALLRRLIAGIVFLFSGLPLFAIGPVVPGYDARYGGMGGTNAALGGSAVDAYLNPANLQRASSTEISFGALNALQRNEYEDRLVDPNPEKFSANRTTGEMKNVVPYFAINVFLSEDVRFGFAVNGSAGVVSGIGETSRLTPTGQTLREWSGLDFPDPAGSSFRIRSHESTLIYQATATHALSYSFGHLWLGAGLQLNYGKQEARTRYKDGTGLFELRTQGSHYESYGNVSMSLNAGVTWQFVPDWRIGYAYQAPQTLSLDGLVRVPQWVQAIPVSSRITFADHHTAGLAYERDSLSAGIDATYYSFGRYTKTVKQTLGFPAFRDNYTHLNYHDIYTISIGVEWRSGGLALRAGYLYNRPATRPDGLTPGSQIGTDNPSVGASYQSGSYSFDLGLGYVIPRRVRGAPTSDWTQSRSGFGLEGRAYAFEYSVRQTIYALLLGVRCKLD